MFARGTGVVTDMGGTARSDGGGDETFGKNTTKSSPAYASTGVGAHVQPDYSSDMATPSTRTVPPVEGYAQHVSRQERRLGYLLWVVLALVLVSLGV